MAFNDDTHLEAAFLHLRDKWGIKSVIETGTFYANTTKWLSQHFEKVYTCEVHGQTYDIAKKQLEGYANVDHTLEGSQTWLPKALAKAEGPVLVFLDAHWFENPLLMELDAIGKSGKRPVTVIHDFKVPGKNFGFDTYPGIVYDWDYIKDAVEQAYGGQYVTSYNQVATGAKRGAIFIEPTPLP